MRRTWLLVAVGTLIAGLAQAADVTIDSAVTTPVKTSDADGGAGDITITGTGSVIVNAAGAVVTLDSDNTVNNAGSIANDAQANALGVSILGGVMGEFIASGLITVGGNAVLTGAASNNFGVRLGGAGTFDGSFTISPNSPTGTFQSTTVFGAQATGYAIFSPVSGNINLGGSTTVFGDGARGVIATQQIGGRFEIGGAIAVVGTTAFDSNLFDDEASWAVAVGANVLGGIRANGQVAGDDTFVAASFVGTTGSKPAFYISPEVAGAAAGNITIGTLTDVVNPGFSIVSRGTIQATGNDPGVNATAMRIAGDGVFTVTLDSPNGIYNNGLITGIANSTSALFASNEASAPANAIGLAIGRGATVPGLSNNGTISASTQGEAGGSASGLLIEPGGFLPSLVNTGTISAASLGSVAGLTNLQAFAIRDQAGTLLSVTNSGTIRAAAASVDSFGAQVAADLSAATSAVRFLNSGQVNGDILYGSGDGNTLVINGGSALVSGAVRAADGGTVDITVANGTLRPIDVAARNLTVGSAGVIEFVVNANSNPSAPPVRVTNQVSFEAGSVVRLSDTVAFPDSGVYTLLTAAGGLSFADFAASSALPLPFLFKGGFSANSNTLALDLQRKSAAEVGLTGNLAAVFEPATSSAGTDQLFGAGLLSLEDADGVATTMSSLLPNIGIGMRSLMVTVTDQTTGAIGARQRGMVGAPKQGLGFWGQQSYQDLNGSTNSASASYFGSGLGMSMGAEWGALDTGRFGVGYTYFAGQVTESHPRTTKANISLNMLSAYGGWQLGNVFLSQQANIGYAALKSSRIATAGPVSRVPRSSWDAFLASGGATAGVVLQLGAVRIIPQISLDGLYMRQGGYTEQGGGGVNLNLGSQDIRSVRLFAGVVAQSDFVFDDGVFQPQILAGWSRELVDDATTIDASFEALPGSEFALVGPTSDASKLVGGAHLSYLFENWSAAINYDASQATNAFSQSATVTLTSRF